MRSQIKIFDYGDWLSGDVARFLKENDLPVTLINNYQSTIYSRILNKVSQLLGIRTFYSLLRFFEFLLMDIFLCFRVLRKSHKFIFCQNQHLLAPIIAKFLGNEIIFLFGRRTICYNDGLHYHCFNLWRLHEKLQVIIADKIIVESEFVKNSIEKKKKVMVVGCWRQLNYKFPPSSKGKKALYFLGDGRKGSSLIKNILKTELNGAHFYVRSPDILEERKDVKVIKKIPRSEYEEFLSKMDIYLCPSVNEGAPRSMYEALEYGVTCLMSKNTAAPEQNDDICVQVLPLERDVWIEAINSYQKPRAEDFITFLECLNKKFAGQRNKFLEFLTL